MYIHVFYAHDVIITCNVH